MIIMTKLIILYFMVLGTLNLMTTTKLMLKESE